VGRTIGFFSPPTEKDFIMTDYARVTLPFGGKDTVFCLAGPAIDMWDSGGDFPVKRLPWEPNRRNMMREFQEMCATQAATTFQIRSAIRSALYGAGHGLKGSETLCIKHVDGAPIAEHFVTALAILEAALYGKPEPESVKTDDEMV
jgi:hypothetical protein